MSTDRHNRPLKPTLASNRTATSRTPLTPRIAGSVTTTTAAATPTTARPAAPRVAVRAPLLSPRVRAQDVTPAKEPTSNGNITPRSSARRSRVGVRSGSSSPANDDTPSDARSRNGVALGEAAGGRRNSAVSGLGLGSNLVVPNKSRVRPDSVASESKSRVGLSPPLVRSPGIADFGKPGASNSVENRFFHASDAKKQDSAPKRPEPKKTPTFFYADGFQDKKPSPSKETSSVLSAVGEKRAPGPFTKAESNLIRSPPMLSPAFNQSSASLSYFPPTVPLAPLRSPSPSKENIHLSYRKGASQIFGMRPTPRSNPSVPDLASTPVAQETRRPSGSLVHRKSSSLSSLNSGPDQFRRRSNTTLDESVPSSPLTQEIDTPSIYLRTSPPTGMASIDTSLASSAIVGSPPESALLSPTKTVTQLAADARRERKVLDLEISNSSLLAINSSLERELRRQKAELKRFRRLSRAGRLSSATYSLPRSTSGDLETLGEVDDGDSLHEMLTGWDEDEYSDSEDSLISGSDARSSSATSERLAKDEKRLKIDLERHRELLVQSQAMNQSLKRCMYATDEMIRDGRKALEYHVRVSDVKLGGRILSPDQEEDDTQDLIVDDDLDANHQDGVEDAKGLLDVWQGVGRQTFEGSEGSGRDSGIEVDKPYGSVSARYSIASNTTADSGRPPEHAS